MPFPVGQHKAILLEVFLIIGNSFYAFEYELPLTLLLLASCLPLTCPLLASDNRFAIY